MAELSFHGKRELRWLLEGGCFVTYFEADVVFSEALWKQWLEALTSSPATKVLLASWGDIKPSQEQWRTATRQLRSSRKKFAVVTESRHTSALAKAASWGGVDMQAFRWEQLYDASVFLELEREQRISIRATITALRDCFGAVAGDAEIGSAIARPTPPAPPTRPSAPEPRSQSNNRVSPPSPSPNVAKINQRSKGAGERPPSSMVDSASRNLEFTRQTSEEIHARLARIQASLRNRARSD